MWKFITDFGDSAVTLPLALVSVIWLVMERRPRAAMAWVAAIGGCGLTMAILKLVFRACLHPVGGASIVSPSGHTAMSTAVYGGLAILATRQVSEPPKYLIFAFAALLVAAIGVSRVVLSAHNIAEVGVGLTAGTASVLGFWVTSRQEPSVGRHWSWLAGACAVVVVSTHGANWPIEEMLHALAALLRGTIAACR